MTLASIAAWANAGQYRMGRLKSTGLSGLSCVVTLA
jgi:hypothetical protein